jgi:MFS family permease
VNVVIAAIAMSATLPGRTHGLGLITKPLVEDPSLHLGETSFSVLNFWAILIGSAACLPVGWVIDRIGVRTVLVGVSAALGASVVAMSRASDAVTLFVTLTLVRGLGQGALSVVSMAMVGKWFTRRLGLAMGIYTALLAVGFIATTLGAGAAVQALGWRQAWLAVGGCLFLGLAPAGGLLVRSTPEAVGLVVDPQTTVAATRAPLDRPLAEALRSPVFWAFTLAAALFNVVWSAVTLFNESILAERGFGHDTFLLVMAVLVAAGLPANLIGGWLAGWWPVGRLLAVGLVFFAGALAAFPSLGSTWQVVGYAAALGVAGGVITVIFFTVYGLAFGRAHLGAIQATVQIIAVFASALGPVLLTACKDAWGSYAPLFYLAAPAAVVLAIGAWLAPMPAPLPASSEQR